MTDFQALGIGAITRELPVALHLADAGKAKCGEWGREEGGRNSVSHPHSGLQTLEPPPRPHISFCPLAPH